MKHSPELTNLKEIKTDFVQRWLLRLPKKLSRNYRIQSLIDLCFLIFLMIIGILFLGFLTFKSIDSLIESENGPLTILTLIFFYVPFCWFVLYLKSAVKKLPKKPKDSARILPTWKEEVISINLKSIKEWSKYSILIGFIATSIISLIVTPWSDLKTILDFTLRNLLVYLSYVTFIILCMHVLFRIRLLWGLLLSITALILLRFTHTVYLEDLFIYLPSYRFFTVSNFSDLTPTFIIVQGSIFLGGAMLWRPLCELLCKKLNKKPKSKSSNKIVPVNRENARIQLMKRDPEKTYFTPLFRGALLWVIGFISIIFICRHFETYCKGHMRTLCLLPAYMLTILSFLTLTALLIPFLSERITSGIKISQSRSAASMGLLPFNPEALLFSVKRALIRNLFTSSCGGLLLIVIGLHSDSAILQISLFRSFCIGFLVFGFSGLAFIIAELGFLYRLRDIHNSYDLFISLLLQILAFCMWIFPIILGILFLDDTSSTEWGIFSIASGLVMIILAVWVYMNHPKKILTLTHKSEA